MGGGLEFQISDHKFQITDFRIRKVFPRDAVARLVFFEFEIGALEFQAARRPCMVGPAGVSLRA